MSAADAGQAQRAAMSQVEKDCSTSTGLRCDVVTFYSGQVYNLYKYKKYTDVRWCSRRSLTPHSSAATPTTLPILATILTSRSSAFTKTVSRAHLDNYLRWSRTGVKDGDLIFVSGHPGTTSRQQTMAQLEFTRDVAYPMALATLKRRIELLQEFSKQSEENARIAKEDIFRTAELAESITGYEVRITR
jgi:hypothetical protein